jgi:hypothetical protein
MAMGSRSSAEIHPKWMRWLLPSIADVVFVALLGVLVSISLSTRLLGDAGIGWHIRTGQLILANRAIPRLDAFSTSSGQPWFAWEWLYDLVVGWLDSATGLNGVVLLTALVIAIVFAWTFRLTVRRGTNILLAFVLTLLAASASMIHFLARPHVLSWLFTVAWFWVFESGEQDCAGSFPDSPGLASAPAYRRELLWLLPLSMLIWVNVHGGFLIGFVLLVIYWFGAVWQWFRLDESRFEEALQKMGAGKRARTLAITGLLAGAATFVNPYGYNLHVHIYRYLSNRFLMDHIDEFQSPNFHLVAQKCFAGLLLLTLLVAAAKGRQISASNGLIVLFAVYSGLYSSRNIPVSSLLLVLVIGPGLSDALKTLPRWWSRNTRSRPLADSLQRMEAIEFSVRGHLWPIAAILLTAWIALHGGKLGAMPLMDARFSPKRFPSAAVDYLQSQNLQGPLLSTDYWGGYLIYRLYPRARVVIDDRHDFYGEDFLTSYLKMVKVEPGWGDFLRQHPAPCLLLPKGSALASILLETKGWKPVYTDEVAVAFVRTATGAK